MLIKPGVGSIWQSAVFLSFILISPLFTSCNVEPGESAPLVFQASNDGGASSGMENQDDSSDNGDDDDTLEQTDSDFDGLTDLEELIYGTDPQNPDTDGEGLRDGEEVKQRQTNPLESDSDFDTFDDFEEIFVLPLVYPDIAFDPNNPDDDRDGYHPLANQRNYPPEADCDPLDPLVNPGADDDIGNDVDLDCKLDVPSWEHTFKKGYTVRAEMIEVSDANYGLKVYGFHDTAPFEDHNECQVLPDAEDLTSGCLNNCADEDYLLQFDSSGRLTGYMQDHACLSWYTGTLSTGYEVFQLSPVRYLITATGKENNNSMPYVVTVSAVLGE